MALFSDGPLPTIDELREQDSQLTDVASTEEIDVTRKLALAHYEVGIELEALLRRTQAPPRLTHVTETPPLRLWQMYRTLAMVYADAYFSHLNDRYMKKSDQFRKHASWAKDNLMQAGVGMVTTPVPRAETPVLSSGPGVLPLGTYYATMSWVNSAGEEGAPAAPGNYTIVAPPDELADQSFAVVARTAPSTGTGWNVFAGASPDQLVLQNPQPLAPGEVWFAESGLTTEGRRPGTGQSPNFYHALPRLFQRG